MAVDRYAAMAEVAAAVEKEVEDGVAVADVVEADLVSVTGNDEIELPDANEDVGL